MYFCCSEHLWKYSVETASQHLRALTVQHGALFQTTRQQQREKKRRRQRTGRKEKQKTTRQKEKRDRERTGRKKEGQEKKEEGKEGEEEAGEREEEERAGEEGGATEEKREGEKEEGEEEEKKTREKKEKGEEERREEERREKKKENKDNLLEQLNPSALGRRKPNFLEHLIRIDVWQWWHQRQLEYDASECGTIPGLVMDLSASEKVPWHVRHLKHRQVLDMAAGGQPYCTTFTWTHWLWKTVSVRKLRTWQANPCRQRSKVFLECDTKLAKLYKRSKGNEPHCKVMRPQVRPLKA